LCHPGLPQVLLQSLADNGQLDWYVDQLQRNILIAKKSEYKQGENVRFSFIR
jgi:hypothetical protein